MTDLQAPSVQKQLHTSGLAVEVYPCVPSTNRLVKERAEQGAPEGLVILADSQTDGRGRLGRSFCSPADTGLYMSVLLRPQMTVDTLLRITTVAAVAVCRAIEQLSDCKATIKWVNDIYCDGKKVCGILTEAAFCGNGASYAVLGIGINVRTPHGGFDPSIADIAASVYGEEGGNRSTLAAAVLDAFFDEYARLSEASCVEEYRARSVLIGRPITVKAPDGDRQAVALGIDDACRLHVRYSDGREEFLAAGDVSVRL